MNTEKIEKLKKGLTNSQIPESLREKIRQQISRLEAEDKANAPAPKEEETPKEAPAPKEAKAPTVRKPRVKRVVVPKKETVSKTTAGKTTAMSVAKEIRKEGEKWTDAVKRAGTQMKKGTTEVKKSTKTEMQKLLALVKRRKELKGLSGTNIKRDSERKAKPKGRRVSENGKVYYENRDNRTDRLAPNYPKNAPLLELGGTVVSDLAGHTSGSFGTGDSSLLNGFSNTSYTGQVGETGAMSSGEMFMSGGKIKDNNYHLTIVQGDQLIHIKMYNKPEDKKDYGNKLQSLLMELSNYGDMDVVTYTTPKNIDTESKFYEWWKNNQDKLDKYELGGGLPSGAEQHYVNYYLGEGASQGIYEHGGEMRDYKEMEDSYARGGGIRTKNGKDYSTGRNWTNDHRHHNKGEDYEVPMNRRK